MVAITSSGLCIVAIDDELMGLCDQLEAALAAGNDAHSGLNAVLNEALRPAEERDKAA